MEIIQFSTICNPIPLEYIFISVIVTKQNNADRNNFIAKFFINIR